MKDDSCTVVTLNADCRAYIGPQFGSEVHSIQPPCPQFLEFALSRGRRPKMSLRTIILPVPRSPQAASNEIQSTFSAPDVQSPVSLHAAHVALLLAVHLQVAVPCGSYREVRRTHHPALDGRLLPNVLGSDDCDRCVVCNQSPRVSCSDLSLPRRFWRILAFQPLVSPTSTRCCFPVAVRLAVQSVAHRSSDCLPLKRRMISTFVRFQNQWPADGVSCVPLVRPAVRWSCGPVDE